MFEKMKQILKPVDSWFLQLSDDKRCWVTLGCLVGTLLFVDVHAFMSVLRLMGCMSAGAFFYFLYLENSPPYTFFLLNGDMEFYRDRHLFI
jgi:hypothetical protein